MVLGQGDTLEAIVEANDKGERILFVGANCQMAPETLVKIYPGKGQEVLSMFPRLLEDIAQVRPRGRVFNLAMSARYQNVGVLQVSTRWPFMVPDSNLTLASLRVVCASAPQWKMTHIVSSDLIGGTRFNRLFLPLVQSLSVPATVWTADYSIA